ncbi:Putative Cytoplasmic protein [Rhizopus microsporus]|nr:Putative Cytoplasmic protein [Rhizopus microsporus]
MSRQSSSSSNVTTPLLSQQKPPRGVQRVPTFFKSSIPNRRSILRAFFSMAMHMLFELVVPIIIYYVLRNFVSPLLALLLAGVPTALMVIIKAYRERKVDMMGVLMLLGFAVSALLAFVQSDPKLYLLRESAMTLAMGLMLLITMFPLRWGHHILRPFMFYVARQIAISSSMSANTVREHWDWFWEHYATFRNFFRALTGIWGLGLVSSKCKFSHDLNVGRKVEKKDLYTDDRAEDTMDKWDQQKLEEVVKSKSGKQPPTDIVCKYFLEAIETNKYGWFWECPNGGNTCKYRHALPPGFVLKSKQSKEDDKEEISLEEFLEIERHKLGPNLTPVTLESFEQWKKNRVEKKEAEESAARKQKETRMKAGRSQGMSGRDLFDFNPTLAQAYDDEEDAIDFSQYDREETERERERLENEQYLSQKTGDLTLQDGDSPSQSDEQVEQ